VVHKKNNASLVVILVGDYKSIIRKDTIYDGIRHCVFVHH